MGEGLSKAVQPEELAVFKKLPANGSLLETIEIPERPENRRPTDQRFLIVFFVVVIILMPFLIYTLVNSDLDRLLKGYDTCGNVCGEKNAKFDEFTCSGQDFTDKKYLQYDENSMSSELLTKRHCAEKCEKGDSPIFNRCFAHSSENADFSYNQISAYLRENAWRIVLACFIALGVTLGMLLLFRNATAAVVWGILGGTLLFGTIVVGGLWYLYANIDDDKGSSNADRQNTKAGKTVLLTICGICTVALIILFFVLAFLYRKVQLVIQLLKEATKAAFAMPLLIFTPIVSFFCIAIIVALLVLTSTVMYTSGTLTRLSGEFLSYETTPVMLGEFLSYETTPVMLFTMIFNFWMVFWSIQFVMGIQYMVIAGAISKWYFGKNKDELENPISTSASVVFKYHLGSVAFGSLIITLIAIVRSLINSVVKNKNLKVCVDCCLKNVEAFIKFLSKNAYIMTALHGKPFYKSGKRAAKIIFQNAVNIAAINYIGDFVLGMAQLLIVLISLLITAGLMQGVESSEYAGFVYLIVGVVSLCIALTFFSIFETTIDTIFLCFCEDSLMNDGMARPYAMSRNLMEFIENSKKVIGEKKE